MGIEQAGWKSTSRAPIGWPPRSAATRRGRVEFEGRYRITDLAAGDHLVRAWTDGGSRQAEARVVVAPGVREVTASEPEVAVNLR